MFLYFSVSDDLTIVPEIHFFLVSPGTVDSSRDLESTLERPKVRPGGQCVLVRKEEVEEVLSICASSL